VVFSAWTAHAFAAEPYVVYTANATDRGAVILRTNPATGSLVEISRNPPQGGLFHRPFDVAVERNGDLLVADMGEPEVKDGAVIRVNPFTGHQTVLASGGYFFDPAGITVGPDGSIYVIDPLFVDDLVHPQGGLVIRVDPRTGAQQLISSNFDLPSLFNYAFGIEVDRDGSIVVANRSLPGALPVPCVAAGSVLRVNPSNGTQALLTGLLPNLLSYPVGLAIDSDGSQVVANECFGAPGLVRVAPGGAQTPITANNGASVLRTPERVGIAPGGDMIVSDYNGGPDSDGSLVKVTRAGVQSTLSSGALFNHPIGVAVVPNRPPVASLKVTPEVVAAGKRVELDASGSRDPEGLTLVYEWDLNGNGTFEAGSGTTATATPRFTSDGVRTLAVRVTDPHGGQSTATARLRVDGTRPMLTELRAARRRVTMPKAATIRFRLSERAAVTLGLAKARPGRRVKGGSCSRRAKRGRRCTVWVGVRTLKRSGRAGANSIKVRTRGLKPGHFRVTLKAADEVGHRSPSRSVRLEVDAAH
jgi:sugar lactone lactonase YvrE